MSGRSQQTAAGGSSGLFGGCVVGTQSSAFYTKRYSVSEINLLSAQGAGAGRVGFVAVLRTRPPVAEQQGQVERADIDWTWRSEAGILVQIAARF